MILDNGGNISIQKTTDSVSVSRTEQDVLSLQDVPKNKSISMLGLGLGITRIGSIVLNSIIRTGLVMYTKLQDIALTHPAQSTAEFDGASDYIQLNDPFSYTNHTIAAWVYVNNNINSKYVFDNRDSDDDGIRLISRNDETIRYSINTIDLDTSAIYKDDWVFAVGTYDGTTAKLYIDGSLASSSATSQTISTTNNATIGKQSFVDSQYYDGNLANVAIWNRALSSDEINSVMWKGYSLLNTSEKEGLQAWYSLEESELLSGDSTATLEKYAEVNLLTFEGKQCVQDALAALPTADAGRVLFDAYDTRVSADGGDTEARTCTINELNAIL